MDTWTPTQDQLDGEIQDWYSLIVDASNEAQRSTGCDNAFIEALQDAAELHWPGPN